MQNPARALESLRWHIHDLQRRAEIVDEERRSNSALLDVGEGFLADAFGTSRKNVRTGGKALRSANEREQWQWLDRQHELWHGQAVAMMRTMSVKSPGLTTQGNSTRLIQRLATAKQADKVPSRLKKAAAAMDAICAMDLMYNSDIPTYQAELAKEKALRKRREREARILHDHRQSMDAGFTLPSDRAEIEARLKGNPDVSKTLLGAIDALTGDSGDGQRQACASARNALEVIVKRRTGHEEWRAGLGMLATGDRRAAISKLYGTLSSPVHAHAPKRGEAEHSVRMAIASCIYLAEAPLLQGPPSP